jgi:hypothetical protein
MALILLFPSNVNPAVALGTVRQIKIDKRLIRQTCTFGHSFKIFDSIIINIDGYLLLYSSRIRILSRIQGLDIIFISHSNSPAYKAGYADY